MKLFNKLVFLGWCSLGLVLKPAPSFNFKAQYIIQSLWQLKLPAFTGELETIMDECASFQRPIILNLNYCQKFVHQCQLLNSFFKRLYIDEHDEGFIYSKEDLYFPEVKPLIPYWLNAKSAVAYKFYSLYFDAVARLYIVNVHEASQQESAAKYTDFKAHADHYYGELSMIMRYLEGSAFEHRYAKLLERYLELLMLLEQNKHTHITNLR